MVDFEVMGVRQDSSRKEGAFRFLEFLLAAPQQSALLGATGYFPVRSKIGAEWAGSALIMPSGTWFDRSEFILWPYPQIVPVAAPPAATEVNPSSESSEGAKTQ